MSKLSYYLVLFQISQTNNVIDNIHSIIAAAAVKFDQNQLEHLVLLIQKVCIGQLHDYLAMLTINIVSCHPTNNFPDG